MIGIGFLIKQFLVDATTSLQDVLFWVGAAPIVLFTIGFFGDFFGRSNISYGQSRSVVDQSSNIRAIQDQNEAQSRIESIFRWIITGLLVWLISYFL